MSQIPNRQKHFGFSMIETLVATLVICIGLLGAGAMQLIAIKNSGNNKNVEQASQMCNDMIERIRANKTNLKEYLKVSREYQQDPRLGSIDKKTLSGKDFVEWIRTLKQTLPNSTGKIVEKQNVISISVQWDEPNKDLNHTNHQSYKMDSQL